jgi:hypothetical protein
MAEKKWASKAWKDVNEGSLEALGWPDGGKLVAAARKDRKKVMSKLNFLANASKDAGTASKARGIIERIKRELGDSSEKKK